MQHAANCSTLKLSFLLLLKMNGFSSTWKSSKRDENFCLQSKSFFCSIFWMFVAANTCNKIMLIKVLDCIKLKHFSIVLFFSIHFIIWLFAFFSLFNKNLNLSVIFYIFCEIEINNNLIYYSNDNFLFALKMQKWLGEKVFEHFRHIYLRSLREEDLIKQTNFSSCSYMKSTQSQPTASAGNKPQKMCVKYLSGNLILCFANINNFSKLLLNFHALQKNAP